MILFDIFTTFSNLSDYVPLIQLLVGSVFVASYMSQEQIKYDPDREVSEKARQMGESKISDLDYEYTNNATLKDYQVVKKSVMSVMAIYGAFVLFYCATFKISYMPSPLGLLLMNFLISIFLICKFFSLGVKIPKYSFSIVMGILVFLTFLICNLFHPDLLPFSDKWDCDWHVIANVWMFINMIICSFMFMLRRKFLPQLLTLQKLDCIEKRLTLDLEIVSQPEGVVERMEYISAKTQGGEYSLGLLFRRAFVMLHEDRLYFKFSDTGVISISNDCISKIEDAIGKSEFCKIGKWILKKRIKKNPRAFTKNNIVGSINEARTKVFEKDAQMLIALGILAKKRTS